MINLICRTAEITKIYVQKLTVYVPNIIIAKMSQISIKNIQVLNNPNRIRSPLSFQITFECFKPMAGTVDWRIIYLSSINRSNHEEVIDQFSMDNLKPGCMQFCTESNPPNFSNYLLQDILGTAAILISASYQGQQFFRTGYYVINQVINQNGDGNLANIDADQICRKIITQNPRIMKFDIEWIKIEGSSNFNPVILQKSIMAIGGDPFSQAKGEIFTQLDKMHSNSSHIQNN